MSCFQDHMTAANMDPDALARKNNSNQTESTPVAVSGVTFCQPLFGTNERNRAVLFIVVHDFSVPIKRFLILSVQ